MQAYEIQAFGRDGLQRVEHPDGTPGPRQVQIAVLAAALNYRDHLIIEGQYNPRLPLPRVPLSDGVGRVTAVGSEVTRVKVGDRVAGCFFPYWIDGEITNGRVRAALGGKTDGMLRTTALLEEDGVVHVPEHLTDPEAATLPCAALTAWNAVVEYGRVRPGETILVMGSGGVSIFALQFARMGGAHVIGTSSSDAKAARLQQLGASHVVNYLKQPDWEREVLKLTGGEGVDHVVEVGGAGTLARSFKAVRRGGRVSLIGVLAGQQASVNPLPLTMRSLTLQGILVGSRQMFEHMNQAIGQHGLRPVIDQTFDFAEAPAALDRLASGAQFGKIVITFERH